MTSTRRDRKKYHHGDLRQALLEAACDHLRHENADTLSLRALAREIGVSQTAPYRHFDSRNALFAAIAEWGFRILEQELQASLHNGDDAVEALVKVGLTYLEFSVTHYEKYQLFFDSSMVDFEEYESLRDAGESSFRVMLGVIERGKAEGVFLDQPEEEMAAMVWSGIHGIASLLKTHKSSPDFQARPVGRALMYLVENRRQAVTQMLNSITRERIV